MRRYKIYFSAEFGTHVENTSVEVSASDETEALTKAKDHLKERNPYTHLAYNVVSVSQTHTAPIHSIEDFELDRVYVVTKDSDDSTFEKGDRVWRDSNNPDRINHCAYGLLFPEAIDDRTVFSAEYAIDPGHVCITIIGEDSRIMSKSFYESNVIIK